MEERFRLEHSDYRPQAPEVCNYGIGLIGCGGIARGAHLPAYRQFGYRVVACCDIRPEAVQQAQRDFNIPEGGTDVEVVLANPEVQIVDLAVHATQRLPLVEKIAAAGKNILSQKPFAMNFADALKMVEICKDASVTLMINQQARWAPAHRAVKRLLESDAIGQLYSVMHVNRSFQDVPGSWYVNLKDFNIIDHGIHYIDLSRYFTGRTPVRVKATTTNVVGQVAISPMIYTINCEYDAALMSTLHFNNIIRARQAHSYTWYLDGTEGSIIATQGEVTLCRAATNERYVTPIQGSWFPDAFGGSMGEMMQALYEKRAPMTSGQDNLNSIKIAYAAVESSTTGEAVIL